MKRKIETKEETAARDAAQREYENAVLRQEAQAKREAALNTALDAHFANRKA